MIQGLFSFSALLVFLYVLGDLRLMLSRVMQSSRDAIDSRT